MKAQVSMEYLTITAFSLLTLTLMLLILTDQLRITHAQAASAQASRLLETLARMINTVSWEGPGSVRSMSIPTPAIARELIGGNGFIILVTEGNGFHSTLTRSVEANVITNLTLPGVQSMPTYRVENVNGSVNISIS